MHQKIRMTLVACLLATVVACGASDGPVPEGTYDGAVAANEDCPFYIDYEILLLYDGSFLQGTEHDYFDSGDGLTFDVRYALEGPFEPGDTEFILERRDTDGELQNDPAAFKFANEQLSIREDCGGRVVYVPLVKRQ